MTLSMETVHLAKYGPRKNKSECLDLPQDNLTIIHSAMDSSDVLHPEGPGDEALPLVPLSRSPPLDRHQRAMALSQLSLQSLASNHYDAADTEDEDETVSMAAVLDWKRFDRNDPRLKNKSIYSKIFNLLLVN